MNADRKTRIVMADDHKMFRQGLCNLLATVDDVEIVGESASGDHLLDLIADHQPDVALVDISMPGPGPLGIVERIEDAGWPTRTVALTMHLEPAYARELLSIGMSGYVVKEAAFEELTAAIRAAAAGDQYLCSDLIDDAHRETPLTDRERECLAASARGQSAKMIGRDLGVTERTVRFHFSNACRKLGVHKMTEAVAAAMKLNLIDP